MADGPRRTPSGMSSWRFPRQLEGRRREPRLYEFACQLANLFAGIGLRNTCPRTTTIQLARTRMGIIAQKIRTAKFHIPHSRSWVSRFPIPARAVPSLAGMLDRNSTNHSGDIAQQRTACMRIQGEGVNSPRGGYTLGGPIFGSRFKFSTRRFRLFARSKFTSALRAKHLKANQKHDPIPNRNVGEWEDLLVVQAGGLWFRTHILR